MILHWSQFVLIAALAFYVLYIYRLRTVLTDRIAYLLLALFGIMLVIDPDLSTQIAHLLGIGRGADLVFYLFMIAGLFFSAAVISELKRLQRQVTLLVRQLAVQNPVQGEASHSDHPFPG